MTASEPPACSAIRVEVDGSVGRLTLARPEKLNALNRAALEELAHAAQWFDDHPAVKVVVVGGDGASFSAGFDLTDSRWAELGPPERSAVIGRRMAESIGAMRAITIASIRGHCIGGGVVLASACDLRVAATGARFRIPEVDLGIPLYWTGIPRLTRELGAALTKELVLTGRTFDADEARSIRFVNRVASDGSLDMETDELAAVLASKSALVLRTTKRQVDAAVPPVPDSDPGADVDEAAFAAALGDPEGHARAAEYLRRVRPDS